MVKWYLVSYLQKFKNKLEHLPTGPGCYLMYDKDQNIIYIGKAKNLKLRVKSYFQGGHNYKTQLLVSEIVDFSVIQTKSELEALILELNLIKKHLPKYNIKLTDDASYPYIVITKEKHPRIIVSRDLDKDKGSFFGPYPNVYSARETVKLLNKMYPLRKCENIPNRPCIYYHMGKCLGACISDKEIDYSPYIKEISAFLKGDTKTVIDKLTKQMQEASDKLNFERAAEFKSLIDSVKETTLKQVVSLNDFQNRDFIAYQASMDNISVQILLMRNGKIVDSKSEIFPKLLDSNDQVISYLVQFYDKNPKPNEICFENKFDLDELKLFFGKNAIIPKIGDKKKIIDIALKNASYDLEHYELLEEKVTNKKKHAQESFSDLLGLKNINRIEAFDNSHLFGAAPISAMVVYEEGKPLYNQYRKYHLKQTASSDDYGAFREVIYRRYQRVLYDNLHRPDMIIVDGGKGQVNAAEEVLKDLNLTIPVVGLKKNSLHQLTSIIYNNNEYPLLKGNDLYLYLNSISEEVHRFAITFHKKTRSKIAFSSHLDNIKGVGPKRKTNLLKKFVSLENMIKGSIEDYQSIGINEKLRERIIEHLKERVENDKDN